MSIIFPKVSLLLLTERLFPAPLQLFPAPLQPDGMRVLIARTTSPDNAASQAVLRTVGFVPTGVLGEEGPQFILRTLP